MSIGISIMKNKMAVIAPAAFINSLGIGTMSLGIIFAVKDLYGASPALVASLGALWSLSYFFGCIVLRGIASSMRPRTSMLVMLVGSTVIITTFIIFQGLIQAFIAYMLYGFIMAFFWPQVMGWLSRGYEGEQLNRATSLFSFSWSVGGIFSSYIAGVLSERGKLLPIMLSAGLFGFNALFVLVSHRFLPDDETAAEQSIRENDTEDRSTPLRYPAWLGAFLIYAVMGVMFNVFPVYARDRLALSESSIGLILTIRAATTALGFFVLGKVTILQFKRAALPILTAASALTAMLLVVQHTAIGFASCFGIVGFLQSAMYNNSLFYATSGALDRDKRASTHEALLTFGQVVGSISGGAIYQQLSMPVVFAGLAGLLAAGTAVQAFMVSNRYEARRSRAISPRS